MPRRGGCEGGKVAGREDRRGKVEQGRSGEISCCHGSRVTAARSRERRLQEPLLQMPVERNRVRAQRATRHGAAAVQRVHQRGLYGGRVRGGVGHETQVGVDRTVEHHGADVAREEVRIDGPQGRPVGHAVVVDALDPQGDPQLIHVSRRRRGVHCREQCGVAGPTGALQTSEGLGRRRRPGDGAARRGGRRPAEKRPARPRSPLVETDEGELVLERLRHQGRQYRQDEVAALAWSARIENDVALALRDGFFHHRQVDRAAGGLLIVQRNR